LGNWNDAANQITMALDQEPLDAALYLELSIVQNVRGNLTDAEAAARRVLEIRPTFSWGHFYLGVVLLARGEYEAALTEMNKEPIGDGRRQGLATVYFASETFAFRGEPANAFRWLERACTQKDPGLKYVKTNRALQSLVSDPRFGALLGKMNLPN